MALAVDIEGYLVNGPRVIPGSESYEKWAPKMTKVGVTSIQECRDLMGVGSFIESGHDKLRVGELRNSWILETWKLEDGWSTVFGVRILDHNAVSPTRRIHVPAALGISRKLSL